LPACAKSHRKGGKQKQQKKNKRGGEGYWGLKWEENKKADRNERGMGL